MKRNKKHLIIFSIILFLAILSVWGIFYWQVNTEVPWPGGESGMERMKESYFIEARNNFFIEQSIMMSIALLISFGASYWILLRKKELVDKIAFGLMIFVTISLFSVTLLSVFSIFPLAFSAFLSLIVLGWGIWKGRWKLPSLPFILSVLYIFYSIFHFGSWFAVYGD
jgi:hypothetical protein